ncbi:protein zer-1, partial [Clarias magur]
NKYCPLLVKEGRIAFLERLLKLESSHQDTKTMARQVMEQCENFKEDLMDTSSGVFRLILLYLYRTLGGESAASYIKLLEESLSLRLHQQPSCSLYE